jgi:predicted ATPase
MHVKGFNVLRDSFPQTDCYPYNLEIFSDFKKLNFSTPVTFFIGENGSGKTTLLKALAKACGIYIWEFKERERINPNPYEESLYCSITVDWANENVPGHYFTSRNFDYFTHLLDEWAAADPGQLDYFGKKSLVAQSHGQSLMSFFKSRYSIKGIYFIDEPETALSPSSQLELLKFLQEIPKNGISQFVIATHSPILLALPGAVIYEFRKKEICPVTYEETDYFKLYKKFMNNRQEFL